MKKRILSLFLVMATILSMCTGFASAADSEEGALGDMDIYNGGYELSYLCVNGAVKTMKYTYFKHINAAGVEKEIPAYCVNPTTAGVPQTVAEGESIKYKASSYATDPKVVGIIANGYPHRGLSELKLDNKYQAYYATKVALWCYLLSTWDINKVTVNPNLTGLEAERAQKMLAAVKDIYTRGIWWTSIPQPVITATPDKEYAYNTTIDGDEYKQQVFTLHSESWVGGYDIDVAFAVPDDVPTGTRIVDMDNNDITAVRTSATGGGYDGQFKVLYPADSVSGDTGSVKLNFHATVYKYAVMYAVCAEAKYGTLQNYMCDTDPVTEMNLSAFSKFAVESETPPEDTPDTSLIIKKVETGTTTPLSGAIFEVKDPDGTVIGSFVSDANGRIVIPCSKSGNYVVTETTAPAYHLLSQIQTKTVQVVFGRSSTVTFENAPYGNLRVEKIDTDTGAKLEGAVVRVKNLKTGATYTATTMTGGSTTFSELEPGSYAVTEITAPNGYVLDSTVHNINVVSGQSVTCSLKNSAKLGLTIVKFDSKTLERMPNTSFEVYRDAKLLGTYTTDQLGEITLTDLTPGTYLVKEVSADSSHIVNSTPQQIELTAGDGILQLIFLNDVKPGIHLIKVDSATLKALPNATFKISMVGGTFTKEFTTGVNGTIDLTALEPGAYTVQETAAPAGYLIDDAIRTIQINGNENASFVFTDTPKPSFSLVKLDSFTGNYLGGATFRIAKIEDGSHYLDRVTDANGGIHIEDLEPGVYSVQEIAAPEGYVLDSTEYHVELFAGQDSQIVIQNDQKPDLLIRKVDADTGKPLSGATFIVKHADGSTVTTVTTGANGEVLLENLNPGVYQVTETSAPAGYLLNNTAQLITLVSNRVGTLIFENSAKPSLTINKVDSITGDPIKGAKFHITYASKNTFSGEINDLGDYYSDENGKIILTELKDGWYRIEETQPADGYALKDPSIQQVYIKGGENKSVTFENVPLNGLVIKKTDADTGEVLQGAKFEIRYLSGVSGTGGTTIGTYTTSANGTIVLNRLKAGTYVVEEVQAPDGYEITEAAKTVYVTDNEQAVVSVEFADKANSGLYVKKIDSVTGKALSGATFKITTSAGTVVGTGNGEFKTDANGVIHLTNLQPDTYVVQEIQAPKGYILDKESQTVKVKADGTYTLTFKNAPEGTLIIHKIDSVTKKPLAGAEFKVTTSDGKVVDHAGGAVSSNGVYTTDKNGSIQLTGLQPNTYIVTETMAPSGYVLDTKPQTVVVNAADSQTLTFANPPEGTLTIHKIDSVTKKPLSGAEFKVTTSDGKVVDQAGGAISSNGIYTTDDNGTIQITGLQPNTYIVTETKAPSGYVLITAPQTVVVNAADTQTLTFANPPEGALIINKLDHDTKMPLEGAIFKVTTSTGAFVATAGGSISSNGLYTTDEDGTIMITGLQPDTYVVTEIEAPKGYNLDSSPQTVVVTTHDTQTLNFFDTKIGGLQIIKQDEDTGERLKGAQFEVRKMNGEIIGTYTTDSRGVITIPQAESGWYTVTELKAPTGYELDTTPNNVCVKDGETATLTITNKETASIMIHKVDAATGKGIYGVTFILYDSGKNPIGEYTSDQSGYVYIRNELTEGKYYIRELEAAEGYILDEQYKTVWVEAGKCSQITWKNTAVTGQIQIRKYAAEANTVTGDAAGTELAGAVYEITQARSGSVVGYITTDAHGIAASSALPLGRYYVREVTAPAYYQVNSEKMEAEIEYAGQIIKLSQYDKAAVLGTTIKKVGNYEIQPGQTMRYDFSGIANTSNVPLNNFYWHDRIPTDATRGISITTGTYSSRLYYRVTYKTNVNDYRVLASNLLTTNNYSLTLSATALGLGYGEYVTDVRYEFGTVPSSFKSVLKPTMTVQVLGTVSNGYQIINRADVGGKYLNEWQTAKTSWVTKVFKFATSTTLPKTGY